MENKKRKKIILITLVAILALPIIIWTGSLIKCEISTLAHGDEVVDAFNNTASSASEWVSGYEWAKIVSYSADEAQVYYINTNESAADHKYGTLVTYVKQNDVWIQKDAVRTLWSTYGNADEVIWPYWYHIFKFVF